MVKVKVMVRVMVKVKVMVRVMVRVKVKVMVMVKVMVKFRVMVKVKVMVRVMVMVKVMVRVKVKLERGDVMKTIKVSDKVYKKIKDIVETEEAPVKDMQDLVGKLYTFWCTRYIYHGVVKKVTKSFVVLENASVVYDTGSLTADEAETIEKLPYDCNIMIHSIESFQKLNW